MTLADHPGVSQDSPDERQHRREMAAAIGNLLNGNQNCTAELTLTAGAATTEFEHPLLTPDKTVLFDPMTAHAATELANGTLYALSADRGLRTWTLTHANNGQTDRTFRALIIGG